MNVIIELAIIVIMACAIIDTVSVLRIEKGMEIMFDEIVNKAEFAINQHKEETK